MTPSKPLKESYSAFSLAAITAGAVGAALLVMAISSIAAILSMGAAVNDGGQVLIIPPGSEAARETEAVPEMRGNAIGIKEEPLNDGHGHFFDVLEDYMSASIEPSKAP